MSKMTSKPHALLGGGTGFIGSALKFLLKSRGYDVTVVSRMPGTSCITWLDVASSGLPEGITAVLNLAGQNILDPFQRWTPGFKQNVYNSRVNTTATLAKAISRAKVKPDVFVCISGVGIYRPNTEKVYTENSEVSESFDYLSKLALDWEAAARLSPDLHVRNVTIRSGVVLARQGGMINQLFLPFYFGVGGPIASGKQPLPWIHLVDICNMFLFSIENKKVNGILNGVSPQIITNDEFTKAFAKALRRPAFFRTPEFALNLAFGSERAKIMTEGQKVVPERAQELGFKYQYPTIEPALVQCSSLFYSKSKPL